MLVKKREREAHCSRNKEEGGLLRRNEDERDTACEGWKEGGTLTACERWKEADCLRRNEDERDTACEGRKEAGMLNACEETRKGG